MRKLATLLIALFLSLGAAPVLAQAPTTVILVRHAEKDVEPEGDPVLTPAGAERARILSEQLADRQVAGVIVTEYARTQLTAKPLADRLGLTPEIASARGRDHAGAVAEIIRSRYAGRTVLVVGHSNTVPAIIAALGAQVEPICDGSFSNLFEVTLRGGRAEVERRNYGAPDPANACDQH
jgi:broad specificity phosphatase PhoE